jgi:hypothetical protein
MKIILAGKVRFITHARIFSLMLTALILIALSLPTRASETWANWTWVNLGLSIPKTNAVVGGKISASILLENSVDADQIFYFDSHNPCASGFGYFSITEVSSGKTVEYLFSPSGQGSYKPITGHKELHFKFNLADGYALSNAGLYSISAVGWFPMNKLPTNSVIIQTPPIIINLSPK